MAQKAQDTLKYVAEEAAAKGATGQPGAKSDSAAVRAAAARIPRGEFALVPGAGHWLPRDAPEAVGAHLLEMITRIEKLRSS